MKAVSETFECLLFNQLVTKSLYNIAIFARANCLQMSEFHNIPTENTVNYIVCSLKRYIIHAYVLNGCNVMHF